MKLFRLMPLVHLHPLGFNIENYVWNFDDGIVDSLSGVTVSHSYNLPGAYFVNLNVIDDNNCSSVNPILVQILVATPSSFAGTTNDTTICLGESICLIGIVNATPYTGQNSGLDSIMYIPMLIRFQHA